MSPVITVALPVFAVIAAGYLAGRTRVLNGPESEVLNKFVFRITMPAALFGLTASATPPGGKELTLALSYGAGALTAVAVGYFLSQRLFGLTKQEAGAHALTSTLGNAVFLGLPIALSIDGWGKPFVSAMLFEGTVIIGLLSALISPRKEDGHALARLAGFIVSPLRNPLIIGLVLGFISSEIGLAFEPPVKTFFDILGRAAGPTALFSLGVFLATHRFPAVKAVAGRVGLIAATKMIVIPVVALSAAALFGVSDPDYWGALALFVAVPSGVGCFIFVTHYRVYQSETASAVLVTTLISILTISTVLVIFA